MTTMTNYQADQERLALLTPGRKIWLERRGKLLNLTTIKEVTHHNLNGEVSATFGPWYCIHVTSKINDNVILADVYLFPEERDKLRRKLVDNIRYAKHDLEDFDDGVFDQTYECEVEEATNDD